MARSIVIATPHSPARADMLRGSVSITRWGRRQHHHTVRAICPYGVDASLELVGCGVLPDAVRDHGTACCTGVLDHQGTIRAFAFVSYGATRIACRAYEGPDECGAAP